MRTTICNTRISTKGRVKRQDSIRILLTPGRGEPNTNLYAKVATDGVFHSVLAGSINLSLDSAKKLHEFLTSVLKEAQA